MGKIILNESQLYNIISESVKRVISEMDELDWKTYQWAADERAKRNADVANNGTKSRYYGQYKKRGGGHNGDELKSIRKGRAAAQQSSTMARDAFNSEFGYDDGNTKISYARYNSDDDFYPDSTNANERDVDYGVSVKHGGDSFHNIGGNNTDYDNRAYFGLGKNFQSANSIQKNWLSDNPDAAKAFQRAHMQVHNFKNGNYSYDKGKGWKY